MVRPSISLAALPSNGDGSPKIRWNGAGTVHDPVASRALLQEGFGKRKVGHFVAGADAARPR